MRRVKAQRPKLKKAIRKPAGRPNSLPRDMVERDLAEVAIRNSEVRYRRLFETAQDGILLLDADTGQITDVNPFLISMLGYSHKEFLGKKPWEVGAFKDIVTNKAKFSELQKKGYVRYENLPLQTRSGKPKAVEFVSNAYTVGGKKVIQCNIRDITERKRAEEISRSSEERFSKAFHSSFNLMAITTPKEGRIVEINDAFLRVLGYTRREIIGRTTSELGIWADSGQRDAIVRKVRKHGYVHDEEANLKTKTGEIRSVILSMDPIIIDGKPYFLSTDTDITERKILESKTRTAAAHARSLIEVNLDPLVTISPKGKITDVNAATENATGFSRERLIGNDFATYFTEPEKARAGYNRVLKEGKVTDYPLTLKHRSGRLMDVIYNASVYLDESGKVAGVFAAARDITARKRAEEGIHKSNRIILLIKECNQALVYAKDERHLLEKICRFLTSMGGYTLAWVGYAVDDEAKSIKPVAQSGFEAGYLDTLDLTWDSNKPRGKGAGRAITSGLPVVSRNIATDKKMAPWRAEALKRGYRSAISVPLNTPERTIGAINIYSPSPGAFDKDEVELLVELGNDLAYGIMSLKNREALAESEERFRGIVETSSALIMLTAPDGTITYISPACRQILGWDQDHFAGKRATVTHPADMELVKAAQSKALQGERGSNLEYRIVTKEGKTKWVSHSWAPVIVNGKLKEVASVVQDITEIRVAQDRLTDIIESLPDPTFAIDLSGRVIYWNKEMENLSGIKSEKMLGKSGGEVGKHFYGWARPVAAELLLAPRDKIEKEYDAFERQGDVLTAKGWVPRLIRGKLGYVWVMVRPLYDAEGGIIGAIESVRDITSQKRNEDALQEKNRMLALISECNQAIVRSVDEIGLMNEICRVLVNTGGYRLAWAGCVDEGPGKCVIPKASYGFEEGYLKTLNITWADTERGRGPTGTAIRTGKPSIARDILNDKRFAPWRKDALARGYASSIALPITLDGKKCGALNIYSGNPDAFGSGEVRLLDELSQDIAHGISALRAKTALVESEKTFAAIFNNATDIVVFLESSGKIQKINPSVRRMWGYNPADIVGKRFNELTDLLPPDSIAVMSDNFRKRVSGEDVNPYVVEARTTEGRQVFVEVRGSAVRMGGGIAGAVVTLSDITKRLSADKRLLASYQVASILSAGGSVADTWPVVLRTICTNLDWAWGEIWVEDEGRKQLSLADSWHEKSKNYQPFEKVTSEIKFKCGSGLVGRVWASGKPVWVQNISEEHAFIRTAAARIVGFKSACAIPVAMGNEIAGVMVFFSDNERSPENEHLQSLNLIGYQIGQFIKRKSAERSLRDSEARFRNIFEHGSIGILLSGPDYRFIKANPAACRIFGYTESELCQLSFKEITHPEHRVRDIEQMERLRSGKIPYYKAEKRYVRKDGQVIWGAVNVSAIRDSKDNLLYHLAMVDDITEQKQNENTLRSQKDQLQELSLLRERFMADMTHELKTPLSVIMLNLDMARNMDPVTEARDMAKSFDLMWRNAMRLSISVEQIMQLTKLESVDIRAEKFYLDHIMRSVIEDYLPLAHSKGLTLDLTGKDIEVVGDPHILSMAVSNLVSNALKFTDQGGVRLVWTEEGGDIVISVSDTGIGIMPENKPKVFDKFFKENHSAPGSGIGLAISSTLIKKMGGRIEFDSMRGQGSTFRIIIPKVTKK